jgi:hypothetical protein
LSCRLPAIPASAAATASTSTATAAAAASATKTTAPAAAAATATTAAASAKASATAAAGSRSLRTRFIHHQCASSHLCSICCRDRCLSRCIVAELHKRKAARLSAIAVTHQADGVELSVLAE